MPALGAGLACGAAHLAWQLRTVDFHSRADCLRKFQPGRMSTTYYLLLTTYYLLLTTYYLLLTAACRESAAFALAAPQLQRATRPAAARDARLSVGAALRTPEDSG